MPRRFLLLVAFACLGCGRTPPPQPEPEPDPDPVLVQPMQEAAASCQTVLKALEQIRDGNSCDRAIAVLRTELPKVRNIREQLPVGLPARAILSAETVEFLERLSQLLDAESALIDAVRDRQAGPTDQLLLELRRYTDELQTIRERAAPSPTLP